MRLSFGIVYIFFTFPSKGIQIQLVNASKHERFVYRLIAICPYLTWKDEEMKHPNNNHNGREREKMRRPREKGEEEKESLRKKKEHPQRKSLLTIWAATRVRWQRIGEQQKKTKEEQNRIYKRRSDNFYEFRVDYKKFFQIAI